MAELITSLQNPALKRLRSLSEKKHRADARAFAVEGEGQLIRARAQGWECELLVSTTDWAADTGLIRWAEKHVSVPASLMPRIMGMENAPPVMAAVKMREAAGITPSGIWLGLEEIRDPGNLGTILRTAEAAGAAGVALIGECCDPFARECVRAATGSLFAMPLLRQTREEFLASLQGWPGEIIGTRMDASHSYKERPASPVMILMGSESRGLSAELARACTRLAAIPMAAGVESLNVAIASALMLYATRDSLSG